MADRDSDPGRRSRGVGDGLPPAGGLVEGGPAAGDPPDRLAPVLASLVVVCLVLAAVVWWQILRAP